jgi:hypothetical protein
MIVAPATWPSDERPGAVAQAADGRAQHLRQEDAGRGPGGAFENHDISGVQVPRHVAVVPVLLIRRTLGGSVHEFAVE